MKKLFFTSLIAFAAVTVFAQAPQGFNYQGVARDTAGNTFTNQNIGIKISILESSVVGPVIYSESHNTTSDDFGVFDLVIGNGTVISGTFSTINWGGNSHFAKIEMDATGGTNYQIMGTTQLLSVPYSLYAENAGNVSYTDTSASNELQTLSFSNDTLYLTNGGYVVLPAGTVNLDNDSTNELQVLSFSNDTLYLTNGGFIALPFNYNDTSATNELQALSVSNDTIFLSNGGFVKLPAAQSTSTFQDNEFEIINATAYADAPAAGLTAALAGQGAGNVDNGEHDYKVTFYTSTGETTPGPVSNSVTVVFNGTDGKIALTNIPVSPGAGVIGRKIYRRFFPAGPDYLLVDTIPDNTTTTYTDSIAFAGLGDTVTTNNTTETKFSFDASQLTANRTIIIPDKSGTMALSVGQVPIGSVVAWFKNLSGVPILLNIFVECNGQTISDPESPLNGITIPNLNGGNRFLRGNSISGTTGGAATVSLTTANLPTHTHQIKTQNGGVIYKLGTGNGNLISTSFSGNSNNGIVYTTENTGSGTAHNNEPQYMNVVWIMRIK